jgi:hypothetical protein
MITISSSTIKFYKIVFPIFWFGFLALFLIAGVAAGAPLKQPIFILMPLAMGVLGFVLMRKLVWDLVDEVRDYGDYLAVRNGAEEDTIAISNIMNVSANTLTNPPRITLRLVHPCKFGAEITFCPVRKLTLNPFAKNQIAEDLIVRVDRARRAP